MVDQTLCAASSGTPRMRTASVTVLLANAVTRAVTTLLDWQQRARQRRELSGLDPSYLKDMGIDRASAYREASKPFWRK